jgi:ABC-type transporter Mla maintaining outer membrane lipid asymmetry ATPase subunit MlaF
LNVADYIAMLHGGRCVAFGHVQRILRDPHPVLRAFLARNVELPSPTDPTATARLPRVSGDTP